MAINPPQIRSCEVGCIPVDKKQHRERGLPASVIQTKDLCVHSLSLGIQHARKQRGKMATTSATFVDQLLFSSLQPGDPVSLFRGGLFCIHPHCWIKGENLLRTMPEKKRVEREGSQKGRRINTLRSVS